MTRETSSCFFCWIADVGLGVDADAGARNDGDEDDDDDDDDDDEDDVDGDALALALAFVAADRNDARGDCTSNEESNSISSDGSSSCVATFEYDLVLVVDLAVLLDVVAFVHHDTSEKHASNDHDGGSTHGRNDRCDDAVWTSSHRPV